MFEIVVSKKSGDFIETAVCNRASCEVGKSRDSLIRVKGWSVAPRHVRFEKDLAGIFVEDVSLGFGLTVNGESCKRFGPLSHDDIVAFADYEIKAINQKVDDGSVDKEKGYSALEVTTEGYVEAPLSDYMAWAKLVHTELMRKLDLGRVHLDEMGHEELCAFLEDLIQKSIQDLAKGVPESINKDRLKKIVLDETVNLGAIEDLLADPDVTEVMVNCHDDIYVEKAGKLVKTDVQYSSPDAVLSTIERIISPLGRRIDESSPMVDARLRDGSRVNAIIPPLALRGPCLTIRKFSVKKLQSSDLLGFGAVSEDMVELLSNTVIWKRNVIVSGGTGSGKTTLLNVLSNYIPMSERVVTVEDAAELQLVQPHVVSLEARPANMEGRGQVTIRELVKNCLRMRPDRIVVGECRGGEALDMLQAMNTGHDGSLTTAHANTPRDMLRRLEVMVLMSGMDLPIMAIREQISSAVHMIVQQTRFPDGSRRVTSITEITGIEGDTIALSEIFRFEQEGYDTDGRVRGSFKATGQIPVFYEELRERGINLNLEIFNT
jgi:pilus assembly protein CpaF